MKTFLKTTLICLATIALIAFVIVCPMPAVLMGVGLTLRQI